VKKCVGVDFGTTNSAIASAGEDGSVSIAHFPFDGKQTETFRSVLYFEQHGEGARKRNHALAGPAAITQYLGSENKGRLIQSLKSYLSSRLLKSTSIFGRPYLLEDLIAFLVRSLRTEARETLGELNPNAVVGRPVRFVGSDTEADDDLAESRLRIALQSAGLADVTFEFEPVAAAYYYETRLQKDELILVADFGGGTSDFSLLPVGPSYRNSKERRRILGNDGVGLAGDAFDAKIVRHLVSPLLGQESFYQSIDRKLQVPAWIYIKLERWHHLSFLKSKETMDLLKSIRVQSSAPEQIESLIHLINEDLGFYLHRAVQQTKAELSAQEQATFHFKVPGISISQEVTRSEFESWIAEELQQIEHCVDRLLGKTNVTPREVNKVFLTGGSSFVPAVREIFENRFGAERIEVGGEFTSVAMGLALRARYLSA
jgi:hypothetical chaperone protein